MLREMFKLVLVGTSGDSTEEGNSFNGVLVILAAFFEISSVFPILVLSRGRLPAIVEVMARVSKIVHHLVELDLRTFGHRDGGMADRSAQEGATLCVGSISGHLGIGSIRDDIRWMRDQDMTGEDVPR